VIGRWGVREKGKHRTRLGDKETRRIGDTVIERHKIRWGDRVTER